MYIDTYIDCNGHKVLQMILEIHVTYAKSIVSNMETDQNRIHLMEECNQEEKERG